nr:unnamed protein product [Spirometra erinaceieuropaei]
MAIRPYQKPLLAFLLGFGFSSLFMSVNFSTPPLIHTRSFRSDNAGPVSATTTSTTSGNASIVIPAATSMTLASANINGKPLRRTPPPPSLSQLRTNSDGDYHRSHPHQSHRQC